jgi:hypothetical protein
MQPWRWRSWQQRRPFLACCWCWCWCWWRRGRGIEALFDCPSSSFGVKNIKATVIAGLDFVIFQYSCSPEAGTRRPTYCTGPEARTLELSNPRTLEPSNPRTLEPSNSRTADDGTGTPTTRVGAALPGPQPRAGRAGPRGVATGTTCDVSEIYVWIQRYYILSGLGWPHEKHTSRWRKLCCPQVMMGQNHSCCSWMSEAVLPTGNHWAEPLFLGGRHFVVRFC